MNYKIYLKYLLLMCLLIFCNDKNNHNETPKEDRKPNNNTPSYINPINSSDADFKYEECKPFPYKCLDKHDNINYDDPRYETWRQGYLDYLKRNEDKIKQEIQENAVKAFEKYYQNPKDNNGASIGSFQRKNMFIGHFINKNKAFYATICESIKKQKKQLMDYFKQENIVPNGDIIDQIDEKYKYNKGLQIGFCDTRNFIKKDINESIDKNFLNKMKNIISSTQNSQYGIYQFCICSFCGNLINTKQNYLNIRLTDNAFVDRHVKLICHSEGCIAKGKIVEQYFFPIIIIKTGKYEISVKYSNKELKKESMVFDNTYHFNPLGYLNSVKGNVKFNDNQAMHSYNLIIIKNSR